MARVLSPPVRRIGMAIFVAAHGLFDYAAPQIVYRFRLGEGAPFAAALLFGIFLGQLSLVTSYEVSGAGRPFDRAWKAWLLALFAWYLATAGILATRDSFEIGAMELFMAVVVTTSCLVLAVGHWIARWCGRGRWCVAGESSAIDDSRLRQFSVRDLLTWTAIVATVCVVGTSRIGRALWTNGWYVSLDDAGKVSVGVGTCAALALCVGLPVQWVVLDDCAGERRRFVWGGIACGVVAGVMAIEMLCIGLIGPASLELLVGTLGVLLGAVACIATSSLALRAMGYRTRPTRTAQ